MDRHRENIGPSHAAHHRTHQRDVARGERRRALEAWEVHVVALVEGRVPATNIVPLAERRGA